MDSIDALSCSRYRERRLNNGCQTEALSTTVDLRKPHFWLLWRNSWAISTTLCRFSSLFIGCGCDNASLSSWRHWFTSAWTAAHHLAIWSMTSVLPAVVVLAHGQLPVWCWTSLVRRRHWKTVHLPSPDRASGTAFLLPSVIRHCRRQSSESCWKLICLFKGRGAGDLWTGAFEMYWLTN